MTSSEWIVLFGGIAAIAWVNWYFFLAERATVTVSGRTTSGGVARAEIVVKGGYSPATLRVKAGEPVRLVFDRQESSSCSEEVVFPDFGVRKFLPAFQQTTIEITPPRAGTYEFTCGMSMLRGTLVADE